ncbi:MAG: hypothetical protein IKE76_04175 [Clostridia bacterium]|nr:hypothetical protein [Clostridia bacterium]
MPTEISPGASVAETADAVASRPKWVGWTSAGNLGGTAELPSGFRRIIKLASGSRAVSEYVVEAPAIPATNAPWRVMIWAPNGSSIMADGLTGIPVIGTPKVRLQENAPSKAVLRIAEARGATNVLDPDFAGWSDGHQEAVGKGMELTVEYRRPDGTMDLAFRGMIYQIADGEAIELTAYDRLMDLYQFSDQYQNGQDGDTVVLQKDEQQTIPDTFTYTTVDPVGLITLCSYRSRLGYLPANSQAWDEHEEFDYTDFAHALPAIANAPFANGSRITGLYASLFVFVPSGRTVTISVSVTFKIYKKVAGTLQLVASHTTTHSVERTSSGKVGFSWATADYSPIYTLDDDPSLYYIGASFSWTNTGDTSTFVVYPTSTTRCSTDYYAGNGSLSPIADSGELPELGIGYDTIGTIAPSSVQIAGTSLRIPAGLIPAATGTDVLQTAAWRGYQIRIMYFVSEGTPLRSVVADLIRAAGLMPALSEGMDLGSTTYYTTSTFNYLDCIHELIRGAGHLLRASTDTAGEIAVLPQHTIDDEPLTALTTAPDGVGERTILAHDLTVHWMAEKATAALLAENSTESGLPLALETDDELMDGSLVKALQSPLRGITVDETMGTHRLMAIAAGGKVRQLHTNTVEGTVTLAGYRTDLWELAGSYAGGMPLRLIVPQYGFDGTAIPTAIELGDGVSKVTLDNIRTADRSEVARSMGLTADAISNTSQKLPATSYIFAKLDTYATQETGITPGTVTLVRWLLQDGTEATRQDNANLIKTVDDSVGYTHVCAVKGESVYGWASDPDNPIAAVEFTMGGTVYTVPLANTKFAIAGQRLHTDIRFRKA